MAVNLDLTEAVNAAAAVLPSKYGVLNFDHANRAVTAAAPHIIAAFVASLPDDDAVLEAVTRALEGMPHDSISWTGDELAHAALLAVADHHAKEATT
jgi:hypothetical protein